MGIFSEVVVVRLSDNESFMGNSWTREDGSFEAFWYEGGERLTLFFNSNGEQTGAWKKYKLRVKS